MSLTHLPCTRIHARTSKYGVQVVSLGHIDFVFVPPPAKSASAFSLLERAVVDFLSFFSATWQAVLLAAMPKAHTAITATLTAPRSRQPLAPTLAGPALSAPGGGGGGSGGGDHGVAGGAGVAAPLLSDGASDVGGAVGMKAGGGGGVGGVHGAGGAGSSEAEVARQREMVVVACESFSDHPDFGKLGFLLTVIIDDLIDAGVRGEGGAQADARVFQLVALLFSSLFRLAAFAPLLALAKEVKQREKKRDKDKRKQRAALVTVVGGGGGGGEGGAGEGGVGGGVVTEGGLVGAGDVPQAEAGGVGGRGDGGGGMSGGGAGVVSLPVRSAQMMLQWQSAVALVVRCCSCAFAPGTCRDALTACDDVLMEDT